MKEYIEREYVLECMDKLYNHHLTMRNYSADGATHDCINVVIDAPAADVKEVRHGRWEQKKHKLFGNTYDYVCSVCGCDYALAEYAYCPNCGAKMDKEE